MVKDCRPSFSCDVPFPKQPKFASVSPKVKRKREETQSGDNEKLKNDRNSESEISQTSIPHFVSIEAASSENLSPNLNSDTASDKHAAAPQAPHQNLDFDWAAAAEAVVGVPAEDSALQGLAAAAAAAIAAVDALGFRV